MITKYLKNIKPFHLIGGLIFLGLLYGAINLYLKIQFYKSFANATQIISIIAEPVEISSINKIYTATSVIEAKKSYDVIAKTDGILNDIYFIESTFVQKGSKLFSILSTTSIGEIIIYAPFDGYVGITDYKIGDRLRNGDLLLTLDDMSSMKANLYLPEKILPLIKGPVKFIASSKLYPDEKYYGVITNIDQRVDVNSRTIRSYALIENTNNLLRPGLLVNVDIILEEIQDAILVPEESILTAKDYSYVFVADNDVAKLKKVVTGITNKGKTEILRGIKAGDRIVTLGHEKLKDGSKIKFIDK